MGSLLQTRGTVLELADTVHPVLEPQILAFGQWPITRSTWCRGQTSVNPRRVE